MHRLFITGGCGYLGREVARQALALDMQVAATYDRTPPLDALPADVNWLPLDIRNETAVAESIHMVRPHTIIHTAFRQNDPHRRAVNVDGTRHIAHAAQHCGVHLVHLSSDVVFDGTSTRPYTEDDPPAPITPYGESKAEAEAAVQRICPDAAMVRTSLIYGFQPIDRHSQFILEVADGVRSDQLFSDEYRCPVFVGDLAAALLELATRRIAGIIHIAGSEPLSRHEFGTLIAAAHGRNPQRLVPALSANSSTPRPRNCVLNIAQARRMLQTPLRGVREVLHDRQRAAAAPMCEEPANPYTIFPRTARL